MIIKIIIVVIAIVTMIIIIIIIAQSLWSPEYVTQTDSGDIWLFYFQYHEYYLGRDIWPMFK